MVASLQLGFLLFALILGFGLNHAVALAKERKHSAATLRWATVVTFPKKDHEEAWTKYKKVFNIEQRPEIIKYGLEHLMKTMLIEKIKLMRDKWKCTNSTQDQLLDGEYWKPQPPPGCDCGYPDWEDRRWREFLNENRIGQFSQLSDWWGVSEYEFRKWLFITRLRREEFKRCRGEWPAKLTKQAIYSLDETD